MIDYSQIPQNFHNWVWEKDGVEALETSTEPIYEIVDWFNGLNEIKKHDYLMEYKGYLRKERDNCNWILNQIKKLED